MHFAGLNGEAAVAEGRDAAVSFLDVVEFQEHRKATSLPHPACLECLLCGKYNNLWTKKEMVPSDPQSSRAPHRHARSKASQTRTTGRYLFGSPLLAFLKKRINASKPACRVFLSGADISK
jgi:hypothetical protein